jgi:hypothetical protein
VPLDGLDADHEQVRYLLREERPSAISLTTSSSRSDKMLPGRGSPRAARCRYSRMSAVSASEWMNCCLPRDRTAGLDEIPIGDRLEHVPGCAGAERLEEVLIVVVHRQQQDARPR